jgi:hypothetical protein
MASGQRNRKAQKRMGSRGRVEGSCPEGGKNAGIGRESIGQEVGLDAWTDLLGLNLDDCTPMCTHTHTHTHTETGSPQVSQHSGFRHLSLTL